MLNRSRSKAAGPLGLLVMALLPQAAAAAAAPPKALLNKYCLACHGPEKSKGGLRVDKLDYDLRRGKDAEHWQEMLNNLNKGEMPPEDKAQPSREELATMVGWIQGSLDDAARSRQADAASVLRRLTREQYTNTLRDLLGVGTDYTRLLPPESPSKMGMLNDGQILASSTLHLEQTMKIARTALDRALSLGHAPGAWRFRFIFGPQKEQIAKKVDLGYQSEVLPPDQYRVETFVDPGPLKTATLTPKGDIRDRCYVDLRGSHDYDNKVNVPRFSVDNRGLLLMPSKPHIEREAQIWQGPNPNLDLVLRDFPSEGEFVLRVTVARASKEGPSPWLRAFVGNRLDDGMDYATFDQSRPVTASIDQPEVIEFRGRLENLPVPVVDPADKEFLSNLMVIGVWNDVLVSSPDAKSPALIVKSMEFEGPVTPQWPSASHRRIFFDDSLKAQPAAYAEKILQRFLLHAFRRPPSAVLVKRYLGFWRERSRAGLSFEEAMRDTLAAALTSPNFLHHVEEVRPRVADAGFSTGSRLSGFAAAPSPTRRALVLDDFSLASRLSYFLWNSMPDEALLEAAGRGSLRQELPAQISRLLADPRAQEFFRSYATQWLDLAAMDRVKIDVKTEPRFNRFVKEDMRRETSSFLEVLFKENRPLSELIAADFTVLNQNLAQFYGIPGVTGSLFQKVVLPKGSRGGGLLTQGSFLSGHSMGNDSHPIKRGVWLAKKLLDEPPPPPPPNVPEIDRENPEIAKMSVKAQLELHRNKEACRSCHMRLDPWGIPFEHFGAGGLWRNEVVKEVNGKPFKSAVDPRTELADGTKLTSVADLQAYLLGQRLPDVRRSAARHLAAYALGRTPGFVDEKSLRDICAQAEAKGNGLGDLLTAVVLSDAFQNK